MTDERLQEIAVDAVRILEMGKHHPDPKAFAEQTIITAIWAAHRELLAEIDRLRDLLKSTPKREYVQAAITYVSCPKCGSTDILNASQSLDCMTCGHSW